MGRIDLYRNVHKGQRAQLFGLAVELGTLDHLDRPAVASLVERLRDLIADLRKHSENEEGFIHPLLRQKAPQVAADLDREHDVFEPILSELDERIHRISALEGDSSGELIELYRAWCRMTSAYLTHIDREESAAMPLLWETCSDEEIFAAIREFVASRSPSDQMHDLITQVPALAPHERAALVGNILRDSPTSADSVFARLADVLSPEALRRLRADVNP